VGRYRGRISGPLLDRIDIQIEVPTLREEELTSPARGEPSARVRARVDAARSRQLGRQEKLNAHLSPKEVDRFCETESDAIVLLKHAIARLNLSARAYHRVLKLARTIADLAEARTIGAAQMAEAIQYRRLDRGT
jgi:magnesium chelatase family protein